MNIGVIGTGDIGAVIVKKLRDAGYPVKMANSKGPDSPRELAAVHIIRKGQVLGATRANLATHSIAFALLFGII